MKNKLAICLAVLIPWLLPGGYAAGISAVSKPAAGTPRPRVIIQGDPSWTVHDTSIEVSFSTNVACWSTVFYDLTPPASNADFTFSETSAIWTAAHRIVLSELPSGTTVYFRVCAQDETSQNCKPDTCYTASTESEQSDRLCPFIIQVPRQAAASGTEVWLEWLTSEPCYAAIYAGTDPDRLDLRFEFANLELPYFLVRLANGLIPETKYYCSIQLWDAAGNYSKLSSPGRIFFRTQSAMDSEAPAQSGIPVCRWIGPDRVEIDIRTNEMSRCQYRYGSDMDCSTFGPFQTLKFSDTHTLTLNKLASNEKAGYQYRLIDLVGNDSGWSACRNVCDYFQAQGTADMAVIIDQPGITWKSGNRAVVEWKTDQRSLTDLIYWPEGNRETYGTTGHYFAGCDGRLWNHQCVMVHLGSPMDFLYKIYAGKGELPDLFGFRMPLVIDTTPPVLKNGPWVFPDQVRSIVFWETDEVSDSQVEYGSEEMGWYLETEGRLTTRHLVFIERGSATESFIAEAISRDLMGNCMHSAAFEITFDQDVSNPGFETAPVLECNPQGHTDVVFTTTEPCTSEIKAGSREPGEITVVSSEPVLDHRITLLGRNLWPSYSLLIRIYDLAGHLNEYRLDSIPPPACTPKPDPEPDCDWTGPSLWMPSRYFQPDEPCGLNVFLCNLTDQAIEQSRLFVILEMFGNYYFAPAFEADISWFVVPQLKPGKFKMEVLPEFSWPESSAVTSEIVFWALLMDSKFENIIGQYDIFQFAAGD